jgi:hypothetical protein
MYGCAKRLLIAAAAVAILCPQLALAQVSYAPNNVTNRQSRTGDVIADGDLNVVDPDEVTSTRTATGNGYSANVENGSLNLDSQQWTDGNVTAGQTVNVQDYAGKVSALSAATGNTGEASTLYYGDMNADVTQAVGARSIGATTKLNALDAEVTDGSYASQAIANSHSFTMIGGAHDISDDQSSSATTQAYTEGLYRYSSGTNTFGATATSNNVTGSGTEGADSKYYLKQSMDGDRTQASVLVGASNAQEVNGTATAVANNISISNEYNHLNVATDQDNAGYVRAEADVNSDQFGAGTANAYGVGNSNVAGNLGQDLSLDNSQTNGGAVQSYASFNGDRGYDAYTSSVSMGNAVTGYACSSCDNTIGIRNNQSSSNLVSASSSTGITGHNRAVYSSATAIGNSATFYNSSPNN